MRIVTFVGIGIFQMHDDCQLHELQLCTIISLLNTFEFHKNVSNFYIRIDFLVILGGVIVGEIV